MISSRRILLTTLLLIAVSPLFGQMCKVELSSPTQSLGVQGKQTVFVEAAFSETYQKKKTVIEPVQRRPLNVSFVLDNSGSMSGQPLEDAKKAMLTILNNLYPGDVVSITVFSDQAKTVLPFAQIGGANSGLLQKGINSIIPEGGTCLFSGVKAGGNALMANAGTNYENCLIVISDGESEETPEFMNNIGKKLREAEVRVICIGLDYDNPLLESLAKGADGQYHHIGQADELAMILMTALEKSNIAASAAFDNKFILTLPPNVTLVKSTARILGSKTLRDKSTAYYFYRFSLPEKSVYSELFELEASRQLKPGTPIAQIQVSYIDAVEVDMKKKEAREKLEKENGAADEINDDANKDGADPDVGSMADDILQKLEIKQQPDNNAAAKDDEDSEEDVLEEEEPNDNDFLLDMTHMTRCTDDASLVIPFTKDKESIINPDFYNECRLRCEVAAYDYLYVNACQGLTTVINERLRQHTANLNRQLLQPIVPESEPLLRQFKQNTEDLVPLVKTIPAKAVGKKTLRRPTVKKQQETSLKDTPFIEKLNVFRADFLEQWREMREKRMAEKSSEKQSKTNRIQE
ncbi:MAG: VWA domain-containing protein [Thermoguttaceae bacterium]|nr:VWA domain-containing protein [Thermoguttaceae bacterium]